MSSGAYANFKVHAGTRRVVPAQMEMRDATGERNCAEKEKGPDKSDPFSLMLAERTGLEPATPGVTGRYSNQLNYRSVFTDRFFDRTLNSGGR
jgi:hypothetical protein